MMPAYVMTEDDRLRLRSGAYPARARAMERDIAAQFVRLHPTLHDKQVYTLTTEMFAALTRSDVTVAQRRTAVNAVLAKARSFEMDPTFVLADPPPPTTLSWDRHPAWSSTLRGAPHLAVAPPPPPPTYREALVRDAPRTAAEYRAKRVRLDADRTGKFRALDDRATQLQTAKATRVAPARPLWRRKRLMLQRLGFLPVMDRDVMRHVSGVEVLGEQVARWSEVELEVYLIRQFTAVAVAV